MKETNEKICVVGAGTMGWGIAQVFAAAGYGVCLSDQTKEAAERGKAAMTKGLARLVDKGKMTQENCDALLARVEPGVIADVDPNCVLAIEAVFESMDVKKAVFKELEEKLSPQALLATNTSSLSVTEIGANLKDPSRFVGMHFFNPAPVMALVEVIGGDKTSKETLDATYELAKNLGKTPVRVDEAPGFVVNRILIPMINEAVGILAEGVATAEDIDVAMKLGANHPLGPLQLGDLIGLDVCLAIMEVLHAEMGEDKYRPHPLLRKKVRAGSLGRKTGQGFYTYS